MRVERERRRLSTTRWRRVSSLSALFPLSAYAMSSVLVALVSLGLGERRAREWGLRRLRRVEEDRSGPGPRHSSS